MVVAVAKAMERRRQGRALRQHREHERERGGVRRPLRPDRQHPRAARARGGGQALPGCGLRRARDRGRRQLRRRAHAGAGDHGQAHPVALVNSVNPDRIEGQKTAAYEVCADLGDAPEYLAIPVGNAGNITAYWKGFGECAERGLATLHPRMLGFQAAGAAPIVAGAARGRAPPPSPPPSASGIPASWQGATAARDESGGADRRRDATTRSSRPTSSWRGARGSSSSRRARRA